MNNPEFNQNIINNKIYRHGEREDSTPNSRWWDANKKTFVGGKKESTIDKTIRELDTLNQGTPFTDNNEQHEADENLEEKGQLVSSKEPILTKSKERRFFVHKTLTNENLKTLSDSEIERMNRAELGELKKHNTWDENTFWDNMEDEDFMPHYLLESAE